MLLDLAIAGATHCFFYFFFSFWFPDCDTIWIHGCSNFLKIKKNQSTWSRKSACPRNYRVSFPVTFGTMGESTLTRCEIGIQTLYRSVRRVGRSGEKKRTVSRKKHRPCSYQCWLQKIINKTVKMMGIEIRTLLSHQFYLCKVRS